MTIDTARLATDAAYWGERGAPEDATHAMPKREYDATGAVWFKRVSVGNWKVWSRYDTGSFRRWCDSVGTSDGPHFITRPQSEWVDGLSVWDGEGVRPPVSTAFSFSLNGQSWEDRVMMFDDGITCLMAHKKYPANRWHYNSDDPDMQFRPIPTKAQRERKDLALSLQNAIEAVTGDAFDDTDALVVANDLLAKGWTKP